MLIYQKENIGKSYEYRSNIHENWVIPPHIHEYSELLFVKNGTATILIEGKKYRLLKNHIALVLPNQVHEYTDETPSVVRCAVFSNDHVPAFFRAVQNKELETPVQNFTDYQSLLKAIEETDSGETVKLCGLLNLICDAFLKHSRLIPRRKGKREHRLLLEVIEYISRNFSEDITLKDIAAEMGYHEKYLSSCLHGLTGMHFRNFLASYRVHYATELLCTCREASVSEIALKCGFSSVNTFNRCFKEQMGMTPTLFRKTV